MPCRAVDQGQSVLAKGIEKPGGEKSGVNHRAPLFSDVSMTQASLPLAPSFRFHGANPSNLWG